METENTKSKEQLRKEALARRDGLAKAVRETAGKAILSTLCATQEYQQCHRLFCYLSFRSEVETHDLIMQAVKDGKTVACPRVAAKGRMDFYEIHDLSDCKVGHYGILEPDIPCQKLMPKEATDLMIVPGSCFDQSRNRIGYGAGFYDRYLSLYPVKTIGLFFDCQETDMIPYEQYDRKVDMIITQTRIFV